MQGSDPVGTSEAWCPWAAHQPASCLPRVWWPGSWSGGWCAGPGQGREVRPARHLLSGQGEVSRRALPGLTHAKRAAMRRSCPWRSQRLATATALRPEVWGAHRGGPRGGLGSGPAGSWQTREEGISACVPGESGVSRVAGPRRVQGGRPTARGCCFQQRTSAGARQRVESVESLPQAPCATALLSAARMQAAWAGRVGRLRVGFPGRAGRLPLSTPPDSASLPCCPRIPVLGRHTPCPHHAQ